MILLLLEVGASTGAGVGAAAVVAWFGGPLELGVVSGCGGCFFFLRRLKRLRRPLLTWANASGATSKKYFLACELQNGELGLLAEGLVEVLAARGAAYGCLAS